MRVCGVKCDPCTPLHNDPIFQSKIREDVYQSIAIQRHTPVRVCDV